MAYALLSAARSSAVLRAQAARAARCCERLRRSCPTAQAVMDVSGTSRRSGVAGLAARGGGG